MIAVVLGTHLADFEAGWPSRLLNANLSESWSHRATAAALVAAGSLALGHAVGSARDRAAWAATGAVLLALFVVEASPAHVEVDRHSFGKLVYLPLLLVLVVAVWRLAVLPGTASAARVALAVLAVSYSIHLFGLGVVKALGWGPESLAYQIKVGLKQGTELAGWLLLMLVLWRVALDHRLGRRRKLTKWAIGSPRRRA